MITDNAPSARMDVPAVREAFIDLRVAELRLLAAKTAVEFCRVQRERDLASLQLLARRRGDDLRPPLKRPISVVSLPKVILGVKFTDGIEVETSK
jgi:hypothetical protein